MRERWGVRAAVGHLLGQARDARGVLSFAAAWVIDRGHGETATEFVTQQSHSARTPVHIVCSAVGAKRGRCCAVVPASARQASATAGERRAALARERRAREVRGRAEEAEFDCDQKLVGRSAPLTVNYPGRFFFLPNGQ
jgi:hypothetical protein